MGSMLHQNTRTWGENIFICVSFFAGPNTGAVAHLRPARIHRTVHRHAQLRQVPRPWGLIVLLPVLLPLTRRTRKWEQAHAQRRSVYLFVCSSFSCASPLAGQESLAPAAKWNNCLASLQNWPWMKKVWRRWAFQLVLEWQKDLHTQATTSPITCFSFCTVWIMHCMYCLFP